MSRSAHRLVKLLPDANGLVVRASDDEFAVIAHCERPHLAVVAFELLDVLKLAGDSEVSVSENRRQKRNEYKRTVSPSQYFSSLSLPTVQK